MTKLLMLLILALIALWLFSVTWKWILGAAIVGTALVFFSRLRGKKGAQPSPPQQSGGF